MQKFYLRKLRTEIFEKYHKIKKIVHMNFDVNEKKKANFVRQLTKGSGSERYIVTLKFIDWLVAIRGPTEL